METTELPNNVLDPIATSENMARSYLRYLRSRYSPRDPDLRQQFHEALERESRLTRGPIVEAAPPYELGSSLEALIDEGILHSAMGQIDPAVFPIDRPLYTHQEEAIRKIVGGRNLIVATGTGSGKTECFLFPIINYLLEERDAGKLKEPGVRALLLYPMNALANDQMKRIRDLMRTFPDVTYGRFIGATPEERWRGIDEFRVRYGEEPASNEMLSREEMREAPPHILLTNYAMLEFLLLRPADTRIFDGPTGDHWKFIILDEVHIYGGARGAEIAMLLRRVRDRANGSVRGAIQYVGTSATLGGGRAEAGELAKFATELFGENVEFNQRNSAQQDIILPRRKSDISSGSWTVDERLLPEINNLLNGGAETKDYARLLAPFGAPREAAGESGSDYLGRALNAESHVVEVRRLLQEKSREFRDLANAVFSRSASNKHLVTLIDVCGRLRIPGHGAPLLSARYHFFLRALEGAFLCIHPRHPSREPHLVLARFENCPSCSKVGVESKLFELGVCVKCRATYLLGETENGQDGAEFLRPAGPYSQNMRYLYFERSEAVEGDEDESVVVDDSVSSIEVDARWLCGRCGALGSDEATGCSCGADVAVSVVVAHPSAKGEPLRRCIACSGRSNTDLILRFTTGQDAPVAVIATALYQAVPEPTRIGTLSAKVGSGRKLLSFADSRQDAAFFAPFLDQTYARAVERRLIWEAVRDLAHGEPRLLDLVEPVRRRAEEELVIDKDDGLMRNNARVKTWLMREVLAVDPRQSLEGVGLAEVTVAIPKSVSSPPTLRDIGFSDDECIDLARVLLDSLRRQAAVHLLDGVDISDPIFAPRNVVTTVRAEKRDKRILSWMPGSGMNRRLDYLTKLLQRRHLDVDPLVLLSEFWHQWLVAVPSQWEKVLRKKHDRKAGIVFAIDPEWIQIRPGTDHAPPFRCNRCQQIWWRSISGVCPTYLCDGSLIETEPDSDDHYLHLYQELRPIGMVVEEHTGQLDAEYAGEVQQKFLDGDINVLSCSTTFELGVDVGEVQAIVMRNVPPSPANYIQRAGRAGRREGSPALVVTFCQRRNHDLHYFEDPLAMVEGRITTPVISIRNSQIVRRHIHALAFAAYERFIVENGCEAHTDVESFFGSREGENAPVDDFARWLKSRPQEVGDAILRITPAELRYELGIDEWSWVEALISEDNAIENHGWLERATKEVRRDLSEFDAQIDELDESLSRARSNRQNNAIRQIDSKRRGLYAVRRALAERRLLDFLSQRVVLPKYGFPVDVVALDVSRSGSLHSDRLDLTRDLSVGITDYAPGSRVVANKAMWETVGLYIPPGKALAEFIWASCGRCGEFRAKLGDDLGECTVCGNARVGSKGKFVIPMFGFIGQQCNEKPGEFRPPRAGYSEFYFNEYADVVSDFEEIELSTKSCLARFSRQGQIVVINRGPRARGFNICKSCGYSEAAPNEGSIRSGRPEPHRSPSSRRECNGQLSNRHLGHQFLTDVVEIDLGVSMPTGSARSTLHAILAATRDVGILQDDVNGTLRRRPEAESSSIVLFDAVPGGAGHVKRMIERLPTLLKGALSVAENCGCGEDSSCYGCLRTYSNQQYHGSLVRGDAVDVLSRVLT